MTAYCSPCSLRGRLFPWSTAPMSIRIAVFVCTPGIPPDVTPTTGGDGNRVQSGDVATTRPPKPGIEEEPSHDESLEALGRRRAGDCGCDGSSWDGCRRASARAGRGGARP